MADPCVCSSNLYVNDDGSLCAVPGGIGLRAVLLYTATGAFTKATYPWLARVRAVALAGGGAGGGTEAKTTSEVAGGGGGGAGGAAEVLVDASAMAASETVTVGAGGAGSAGGAGGNGATSSFGAFAVATGGTGGALGTATGSTFNASSTGAGGAGTTGDVLYQGGDGEPGLAHFDVLMNIGGAGGASLLKGMFFNNVFEIGFSAGVAADYENKGWGGIGAASPFSETAARRGQDAADGLVIVYLYA